jgi:hypothetical protein
MVARPQPTALSYAVESGLLSIPPTVMSLVSALSGATWAAALAAGESGPDVVYDQTVDSVRTEAERIQGLLIECIFGNPFRPVAFAPSWRSETAVALAAGIYSERAFDRLPVLADALEEAGCDDPDVLSHLRGPGPHARGCWVVDAVLGKA